MRAPVPVQCAHILDSVCIPLQSAARRNHHNALQVLIPQRRSCPAVITPSLDLRLEPKASVN